MTPDPAVEESATPKLSNLEPASDAQSIDTDDDYDLSGLDDSETGLHTIRGPDGISEHAAQLSDALCAALDSAALDESLASQAKTSGAMNNETRKLIEKEQELRDCFARLRSLYSDNFALRYDPITKKRVRAIDTIANDFAMLEKRLDRLVKGPKAGPFAQLLGADRRSMGVMEKFPIEYNQARDKVLERTLPDE